MRTLLLSIAALLLAAPPAAAVPSGSVRVLECTPALEESERSVTFEGRMRPIARTVTMALRFTLKARSADDAGWRRLHAEGFDVWLQSEPGVRRYIYAKTVRNLLAPAAYRATVRFRWLDAAGRVIARSSAVSATCAQPDLRADLVLRGIDAQPLPDPGLRRYEVLLENAGAGGSGASVLRLDVPGRPLATATVAPLAAGESRAVSVVAPACAPGDALVATADAAGQVEEADEDANAVEVACPASGPSAAGAAGAVQGTAPEPAVTE
ncbi:MAG TPA: CARDB domain-containing protein [Solirubrobacteraceae bacterium]|nr:CARDB domain-containing protein [Solirubrobacteraceae bacterium]